MAQMQALMAEANAAKIAKEKEKEAEAAMRARNAPQMLRGARLNVAVKPPVAGNALSAAAAKAQQEKQQQGPATPKTENSAGAGESTTNGVPLAKTGEQSSSPSLCT